MSNHLDHFDAINAPRCSDCQPMQNRDDDHVEILTMSDGSVLLVEPEQRYGRRRAFRRIVRDGVFLGYDWAYLDDVETDGPRTRFYGWHGKTLPDTMTNP